MRRKKRVADIDWDRYKKIINDFMDVDAGKQPFLWLNKINQPLPFGEDLGTVYTPYYLEGLFQYNYIKSWPTQPNTISGELDYSNIVLYISARLLRLNSLVNQYGYWDYNWADDRFIVNGKVYRPGGDTQVAQAKDEALLFFVILQREDPEESDKILNSYTGPLSKVVTDKGIWLLDSEGNMVKDICNLPIRVQGPPDIPLCTLDGVLHDKYNHTIYVEDE